MVTEQIIGIVIVITVLAIFFMFRHYRTPRTGKAKVASRKQIATAGIEITKVSTVNEDLLHPQNKNGKYIIPKDWNAVVFRPSASGDYCVGWFEHVDNPMGREIDFVEENPFMSSRRKCYVMQQVGRDASKLEEYERPEAIECLPESLYQAHKGCQAYGRFLAHKNTFMEKLKIVLIGGIIFVLIFVAYLIIAG